MTGQQDLKRTPGGYFYPPLGVTITREGRRDPWVLTVDSPVASRVYADRLDDARDFLADVADFVANKE